MLIYVLHVWRVGLVRLAAVLIRTRLDLRLNSIGLMAELHWFRACAQVVSRPNSISLAAKLNGYRA